MSEYGSYFEEHHDDLELGPLVSPEPADIAAATGAQTVPEVLPAAAETEDGAEAVHATLGATAARTGVMPAEQQPKAKFTAQHFRYGEELAAALRKEHPDMPAAAFDAMVVEKTMQHFDLSTKTKPAWLTKLDSTISETTPADAAPVPVAASEPETEIGAESRPSAVELPGETQTETQLAEPASDFVAEVETQAAKEDQRLAEQYVVSMQEENDKLVAEKRQAFINRVGGYRTAGSFDMWEALRNQQANNDHAELNDILRGLAKFDRLNVKNDIIDEVIAQIDVDMHGARGGPLGGKNIVDFVNGGKLRALLDSTELESSLISAKATFALYLLATHGQCKFHKWGNGDQLESALQLLEDYTRRAPGFVPHTQAVDQIKGDMIAALAALEADNQTKPNYSYAKPERGYLFKVARDSIERLDRIAAYAMIRNHEEATDE